MPTVTSTCESSSRPGSLDTQYNVLTLQKLVNNTVLAQWTRIELLRTFKTLNTELPIYIAIDQLLRPFHTRFNSKLVEQ